MFKKAGVVAAAAAGLLMLGGPAFAGEGHGHGSSGDKVVQNGLINLNNIQLIGDININIPIAVCNNNVNLLGIQVPIGSPQKSGDCASGDIED